MNVAVVSTDDLEACFSLRRIVFIDEQGVPEAEEIDELDPISLHFLAMDGETPVGTARIFIKDNMAKIGRVCVLQSHRGQGVGVALIRAAMDAARGKAGKVMLGAQVHAKEFYAALGFRVVGPVYDDAGIDHRDMVQDL